MDQRLATVGALLRQTKLPWLCWEALRKKCHRKRRGASMKFGAAETNEHQIIDHMPRNRPSLRPKDLREPHQYHRRESIERL